ncbi:hypothetical protein D3C87_1865510 [compost metagenome]
MNLMFEELVKSAFNVFYPDRTLETNPSNNNLTKFPKNLFNNKDNKTNNPFNEMLR